MQDRFQKTRELIEGAYDLVEWHIADGVVRPPQAEGRFMLMNGAVSTILHNRSAGISPRTIASYGTYTLTHDRFAYAYDHPMSITQREARTIVSTEPMWEGRREFALHHEEDGVRLNAASGHEFWFTRSGLRYSENGKTLRVWLRVAAA